jgi:hypothetical protein
VTRVEWETQMEVRLKGIDARGEAAILRVSLRLKKIEDRLAKLEKRVNGPGTIPEDL